MAQETRINYYYTSDLHFGHKNILKFCQDTRKFEHLFAMEQALIKRWNATVKPHDVVIVLGDVFLGSSKKIQKEILAKLNGKKILVKGNHDKSNSQMMSLGFEWSCDEMVRYIQGERVILSHYPFMPENTEGLEKHDLRYADRRPKDDGKSILLHGHTHSKEKVRGRMIHIGVDAWNMTPVSENKIASMITQIRKDEEQAKKEWFEALEENIDKLKGEGIC